MRKVIWLLLVVSAAVGVALLMRASNGNVAVLWPPYRFDVSVNLAVVVLIVLFVLLHLLFNMLAGALRLPARMREYRERRRRERAVEGLRDSVLALLEGRYGRAERLARTALGDETLAGPAALIGAHAAQRQHERARRNKWLESARSVDDVEGAFRTTLAEIALEEGRPADALTAISEARVRGVRHQHGLRLALRAHERMGDWRGVLDTLRQLERRDGIEPGPARRLRVLALTGLLDRAGDDAHEVAKVLDDLPAVEREIPEVQRAAARALLRAGRQQAAAGIVERVLGERYDGELVALWPELTDLPARGRLARGEKWLQQWGDQPGLLIALGRLCASEGLWGKAEAFLLHAERVQPDALTRTLLARMCERLDREDDARRWYREAALSVFGEDTSAQLAPPERLPVLPPVQVVEEADETPKEEDEPPARPAAPLPGP